MTSETQIKTPNTPDSTYSNGDETILGRRLYIFNRGKGKYTFTLEEETFYPEYICDLNVKSPFKVVLTHPKLIKKIEHGITRITRSLEVSVKSKNGDENKSGDELVDFKSKQMGDLITF